MKTVKERFDEKYEVNPDTGCWVWMETQNKMYGRMKIKTGEGWKELLAHRVSWMLHKGEHLEYGLLHKDKVVICHTCDNPKCVNPAHLFKGTQKDNMQDCSKKDRLNSNPNKGELHQNATVSDRKVREAMWLRGNTNMTFKEIAEVAGVNTQSVCNWWNKQTRTDAWA